MQVKITVSGPSGQQIVDIADVQKAGELSAAIGKAYDEYRKAHPAAPPFEATVKVEHA